MGDCSLELPGGDLSILDINIFGRPSPTTTVHILFVNAITASAAVYFPAVAQLIGIVHRNYQGAFAHTHLHSIASCKLELTRSHELSSQ